MMTATQWYLICLTVCNVFLCAYGNFVRTPANDRDLQAVFKDSYELTCTYNGPDESGDFLEWYRDDEPIAREKTGHFLVKSDKKETTLKFIIFVSIDAAVKKWSVKTSKPDYENQNVCEFGPITAIPSPQGIKTDRDELLTSRHESIRRVEDETAGFQCLIKPEQETALLSNSIVWEYSSDEKTFERLGTGETEIEIERDTLKIGQVKKHHRGYYRCTLNNISYTVLLRVKDRLAALWPFLGIVGIVVVLVIIILIFEKRQRTARRALPSDEEDQDHANDPLVRSGNKTTDNENKKRAVKA